MDNNQQNNNNNQNNELLQKSKQLVMQLWGKVKPQITLLLGVMLLINLGSFRALSQVRKEMAQISEQVAARERSMALLEQKMNKKSWWPWGNKEEQKQ